MNIKVVKSVGRSLVGVKRHRGKGAARRGNEKVTDEMHGRTLKRSAKTKIGKGEVESERNPTETEDNTMWGKKLGKEKEHPLIIACRLSRLTN